MSLFYPATPLPHHFSLKSQNLSLYLHDTPFLTLQHFFPITSFCPHQNLPFHHLRNFLPHHILPHNTIHPLLTRNISSLLHLLTLQHHPPLPHPTNISSLSPLLTPPHHALLPHPTRHFFPITSSYPKTPTTPPSPHKHFFPITSSYSTTPSTPPSPHKHFFPITSSYPTTQYTPPLTPQTFFPYHIFKPHYTINLFLTRQCPHFTTSLSYFTIRPSSHTNAHLETPPMQIAFKAIHFYLHR